MNRTPLERRRRNRRMPKYTVLKCRAGGRHQVGWCFRMCKPVQGFGLCGRVAPHGFKGHLRQFMERQEAMRQQEAS
jgi:hypothetical protein